MRTIITTNQGESREICGNSRKTLNQIVTTLFGPTRGPLREEPGNQGVFAHGSCQPGWLHPKHGVLSALHQVAVDPTDHRRVPMAHEHGDGHRIQAPLESMGAPRMPEGIEGVSRAMPL